MVRVSRVVVAASVVFLFCSRSDSLVAIVSSCFEVIALFLSEFCQVIFLVALIGRLWL